MRKALKATIALTAGLLFTSAVIPRGVEIRKTELNEPTPMKHSRTVSTECDSLIISLNELNNQLNKLP
jgi:hypothetical protein